MNMLFVSVTFSVLKLLKSRLVRSWQSQNMSLISVTFAVSNLFSPVIEVREYAKANHLKQVFGWILSLNTTVLIVFFLYQLG